MSETIHPFTPFYCWWLAALSISGKKKIELWRTSPALTSRVSIFTLKCKSFYILNNALSPCLTGKTVHVCTEIFEFKILDGSTRCLGKLFSYHLKILNFELAWCLNLFLKKLRLQCHCWKIGSGMFYLDVLTTFQIRVSINIKHGI